MWHRVTLDADPGPEAVQPSPAMGRAKEHLLLFDECIRGLASRPGCGWTRASRTSGSSDIAFITTGPLPNPTTRRIASHRTIEREANGNFDESRRDIREPYLFKSVHLRPSFSLTRIARRSLLQTTAKTDFLQTGVHQRVCVFVRSDLLPCLALQSAL